MPLLTNPYSFNRVLPTAPTLTLVFGPATYTAPTPTVTAKFTAPTYVAPKSA